MKDRYVKFCPNCGSPDVEIEKSNPLVWASGMPARFICNNCNYSAPFFPEIKISELDKLQEDLKLNPPKFKKKEVEGVDLSYGNFTVKAWWKVISPVMFAVGIYLIIAVPEKYIGIIFTLISLPFLYYSYFRKKKKQLA